MRTLLISEEIFEILENRILSGEYKKGEVISENKLSAEFNVSRTPVREAIKRLEQENLIVYENSKTAKINGFDKKDVEDIYDIRLKLEPKVAVMAAENANEKDIKNLQDIVDLQGFYLQKNDTERLKSTDSDFHKEIFKLCGSKIYCEILENLHCKVQRFRKTSIEKAERAKFAYEEHKQILEAIKAKNYPLIETLTENHIINARENIMKLNIFA